MQRIIQKCQQNLDVQIGQNSNKSNLNFSPTGTDKVSKKQVNACHRTQESLKTWRPHVLLDVV